MSELLTDGIGSSERIVIRDPQTGDEYFLDELPEWVLSRMFIKGIDGVRIAETDSADADQQGNLDSQ